MDTQDYFGSGEVQVHGDGENWSCVVRPGRYQPNTGGVDDETVAPATDEEEEFQRIGKAMLDDVHREMMGKGNQ